MAKEDLMQIKQLLDEQKQEITGLMDQKLQEQDKRFDQKLQEQKQDLIQCMNVLIESDITPKFNLLAESIADIQEKLIPRSRVDELEEEVKFMKIMYRQMAKEIEMLKKAQ